MHVSDFEVPHVQDKPRESGISRAGLNAANFFQAEAVGVVLPVLSAFLRASGWRFDAIGIATAAAGLGTLVMQTPAGLFTDRINSRRGLFAATCLVVGLCFVFLPAAAHSFTGIVAMLFTAGAAQSFLAPVLAALALSLVGQHLGFTTMLLVFAGIAACGALWFQTLVRETAPKRSLIARPSPDLRPQAA